MKLIEQLAINYLLKRGYEIRTPKIYFSGSNFDAWGGATYWQPIANKQQYKPLEKKTKYSIKGNQLIISPITRKPNETTHNRRTTKRTD